MNVFLTESHHRNVGSEDFMARSVEVSICQCFTNHLERWKGYALSSCPLGLEFSECSAGFGAVSRKKFQDGEQDFTWICLE
eukprot:s153_g17.t1